jgi:hypothetical protein
MSKKTFKISSSLYSINNIQDAISAFDGYQIDFDGNTISIDDENPQYVFDELMNYILSISLENNI